MSVARARNLDSTIQDPSLETLRILLVEDNPDDVDLFNELLLESPSVHFEVTQCERLAEAMQSLRETKFNAVLLDLGLPDSQNIESFFKIQHQGPEIPIVVLTSLNDKDIAIEAVRNGAQEYLVKGEVSGSLLVRSIEYAIERKQAEGEIRGARDELELRVKERTKELSYTNEKLKDEIDERKKVEKQLRKANKEIENLLSSLSSIFVSLSSDHRVVRWNPAAEKAFGLTREAVMVKALGESKIPWDWGMVREAISKCQGNGCPIRVDDVHFKRPDGKDGFLGITINPVKGDDGGVSELTIIGADITEKKILESQLMQAQKLEAIGQLAAGIAHEINTPTQYVGDNTRFFQDAFNDLNRLMEKYGKLVKAVKAGSVDHDLFREIEEEVEEVDVEYLMEEIPKAIEQSLEGVDRISRIVLAMKNFSHPGTAKKTAVDINKAIESTLTVARNEWKYVADLVTDFDLSLPPVPCLPGEFNQVILNMIINAAHAIEEVGADRSQEKGTITISTRRAGNHAEIKISDTGRGIPEEIRSRIFDPFFTTKELGKGTGQGLAISYLVIVEKHKGTITVETEVGKGTTFIIRLPMEIKEA